MIFDTHTHLNADNFTGREAQEIEKAREFGVTKLNIVGFDTPTIEKSLALAAEFDNLYATIGWHPTEAGSYTPEIEKMLVSHLADPKVIALGEIGLDYHWMSDEKAVQESVFRRQIQLSKTHNLPFMVHTRDALADTYEIIKSEGVGPRGGIMHSFSGSYQDAMKFIDLGMLISFSGVVTFKKSLELQEAAKLLPLDKLLVETDAPYLAPMPFRGRENTPAYTKFVVEKIAELREISSDEVANATYQNALKVFDIHD
ncbi:TatD family hydrolase [Lactococcus piscium]|uniref:TatD family hydrolase n=1 Tax=Pseudolactococcus carnosus TaxID=2749961 RepID=UPI001FBB65C2|nr:TatD family hydrolase [Lactococcus carnosus]MCJ1996311.1 TatD family hydrolase [Lactococcus carnosus]